MSEQTRRILMWVAGIGFVFLALVIGGGYVGYHYYLKPVLGAGGMPGFEMPAELENPAVLEAEEKFTQEIFFENSSAGTVTFVGMGQFDGAAGEEIGIAVEGAAAFLSPNGVINSTVTFGGSRAHVDIVDVEGDGTCEFMNRGSWGVPASLIDHGGDTIWSYGGTTPGVDDMAAGDLDGDGDLDFAVGFNGGGGVHRVDTDGNRVWRKDDGNVWHVEIVDTDGDGTPEIIHSNAAGQMKIRDTEGTVVATHRPEGYFAWFSICRWPVIDRGRQCIMHPGDGVIRLLNFDGTTATTLDAPGSGMMCRGWATPVRFNNEQPPYFAAVVWWMRQDRSVLFIYDPQQRLVYREVIGERCGSIAAVPAGEDGSQKLLVGGTGKVWAYTPHDGQ